ncbi:MAG: ComEC/Rec2 family competence protein, partial [Rothia sp. (in: high G+C Gram-positive bacteria)]|uniref:ComEC/Rec2 family competence protein n=1 Tax=Rothia sp. (in: high G+C Gram-positive bacteria) TaxID=1885016 RepID=UPI0026DF68E2
AGLGLGVAVYGLRKRPFSYRRRVLALPAFLTWGLCAAAFTALAYTRVQIHWPEHEQSWVGSVVETDKRYDDGTSVRLRLESGDEVRLRVLSEEAKELKPADRIAFMGQIRQPKREGNPGDFDYPTYLQVHGISGVAYVPAGKWRRLAPEAHPSLSARLLRLRTRLTAQYAAHFEGSAYAILSALTLGDKSTLSPTVRALFSDTGVSHVLALSGLHLGILFSLLQLFLLRPMRWGRWFFIAQGLALMSLWGFVLLAGAPLSLQRSAWMFTLLQLGLCLQRAQGATPNNLALASLVILSFSPLSLFDVGFQLSFLAVAGIVWCGTYVWRRIPLPYPDWYGDRYLEKHRTWWMWLRDGGQVALYWVVYKVVYPLVTVSLSAQFATLPLVVYYFHNLPLHA